MSQNDGNYVIFGPIVDPLSMIAETVITQQTFAAPFGAMSCANPKSAGWHDVQDKFNRIQGNSSSSPFTIEIRFTVLVFLFRKSQILYLASNLNWQSPYWNRRILLSRIWPMLPPWQIQSHSGAQKLPIPSGVVMKPGRKL